MSYYNHSTTYTSFATDAEALAWAYASSQNQSYAPSSSANTSSSTQQAGSSNQTHIQIVLEPAESCNDSGEGSGQDDSDGGRKRACERCKKIKVKCEYPTGVKTCNRCSKMGLTCVPGKQKERKVRPRLSAYDQVMDVGSSSGGQK